MITPPADCAVVFGGHIHGDGSPSAMVRNRVSVACRLWHDSRIRKLILTGTPGEAQAMYAAARRQRVSDGDLIVERTSFNTAANVEASLLLMRHHGLCTAVAVSDAWHLPRIQKLYASRGATVEPVAAADDPDPLVRLWWSGRELVARATTCMGLLPTRCRGRLDFPVQPQPLANPRIKIAKAAGRLTLFDGDALVAEYPAITGDGQGDKQVEGDRRTPVGDFYVCSKNPDSEYHLSLGLSYPNAEDAARGLAAGLIMQEEHDLIVRTVACGQSPPWDTPLGGEIMIHGHRGNRPGTAGCIALDDEDIERLYGRVRLGTPVVVRT
jgi:uncharacterized SAM-binding protein YcdF (DUF218 family)